MSPSARLGKSFLKGIQRRMAPRWFWRSQLDDLHASILRRRAKDLEFALIPLLCEKSKTSIDIGAAEGVYTINMMGASRNCWAFEPRLEQLWYLAEMVEYLSIPVQVEAAALSNSRGEAILRILEYDVGRSTIEPENALDDPEGSRLLTRTVPTRRLDDYELDAVGFVKIDVEGHELSVLQGGLGTIQRCVPVMFIEMEERHKPNSTRDVSNFLKAIGYDGYFIINQELVPIRYFEPTKHQKLHNVGGWKSNWKKSGIYVNNFFFVPKACGRYFEQAFIALCRTSDVVSSDVS